MSATYEPVPDEAAENAVIAEFDEEALTRAKLRGAQGNLIAALKAVEAAQAAAAKGRQLLADCQLRLASYDDLDTALTEALSDDIGSGRLHHVPQSVLDRQAERSAAFLALRTAEAVFQRHGAAVGDAQERVKRAERVRDGRAIETMQLEIGPLIERIVELEQQADDLRSVVQSYASQPVPNHELKRIAPSPEPPAYWPAPMAPSAVAVMRARESEPTADLKRAWRDLLARLRVDPDAKLADVLDHERDAAK